MNLLGSLQRMNLPPISEANVFRPGLQGRSDPITRLRDIANLEGFNRLPTKLKRLIRVRQRGSGAIFYLEKRGFLIWPYGLRQRPRPSPAKLEVYRLSATATAVAKDR